MLGTTEAQRLTALRTRPAADDGASAVVPTPSGSTARQFWSLAVAAVLVVAAFVVWVHVEIGGPTVTVWVNDLTEIAAAVVAALVCIWAARRRPATRRAWTWLAAASAAWAVGQAVWSWYELRGGEAPFPSVADVGFLLFVPLAVVGILLFPFAPRRSWSRFQVLLDGMIIAASLLFVSWATSLGAAVDAGSETSFAQVVALGLSGDRHRAGRRRVLDAVARPRPVARRPGPARQRPDLLRRRRQQLRLPVGDGLLRARQRRGRRLGDRVPPDRPGRPAADDGGGGAPRRWRGGQGPAHRPVRPARARPADRDPRAHGRRRLRRRARHHGRRDRRARDRPSARRPARVGRPAAGPREAQLPARREQHPAALDPHRGGRRHRRRRW